MFEWLFEPPGARPDHWQPHRAAAALDRAVTSASAIVLLATLGDEFVGVCTAYDDMESVRFGRRGLGEGLAVDPDTPSLGIRKQLLERRKPTAPAPGPT